MKSLGIILAAGKSTRLYPATIATTKQLLPVYDKPLIYYPLTTLMLAGIRDYVIITSPQEQRNFEKLFIHAETQLGIRITFIPQDEPTGIADAFNLVSAHISADILHQYDTHTLILGDNVFYGAGLRGVFIDAMSQIDSARIFLYPTQNPTAFGIAEIENDIVISLEEKPEFPKSNLAVTGLYMYPVSVYDYAKKLAPSRRGELEITDLNMMYLKNGTLRAHRFSRGTVWFDTGTPESLLETSNFIYNIQKHQNYLVGSPHEISINNSWATYDEIIPFIQTCMKTEYGKYLHKLLRQS